MLPDDLLQRAAMANMLGGMPPKPEPNPKGMMALGTQQPMGAMTGPQMLPTGGGLPVIGDTGAQAAMGMAEMASDPAAGQLPVQRDLRVPQAMPQQTPLPGTGGAPMDMIDPNALPRDKFMFDGEDPTKVPPADYYPMPWTN